MYFVLFKHSKFSSVYILLQYKKNYILLVQNKHIQAGISIVCFILFYITPIYSKLDIIDIKF